MPKLEIIRFRFTSPLHIGNERSDYGKGNMMLQSDAITAAIYFAWNQLGCSDWIPANENDDPGFAISSLFPFTSVKDKPVYFLPRPMLTPREIDGATTNTILRKQLKKIAWVDHDVFKSLLEGKHSLPKKENILGTFQSAQAINDGNIPFVSSHVVPRAAVSRTGEEDTVIFYTERYYFRPGSGLYLMASFGNEESRSRLLTALNLLSDEGVGTDRNVGNGKFTYEIADSIYIPSRADASHGINLGLFCPASSDDLQEMLGDINTGYDFIQRGGWLSEPYNNYRKRSVYMFKPGSVFKLPSSEKTLLPVFGKAVDVKPLETLQPFSHPIWRSGKTIFYPFKLTV